MPRRAAGQLIRLGEAPLGRRTLAISQPHRAQPHHRDGTRGLQRDAPKQMRDVFAVTQPPRVEAVFRLRQSSLGGQGGGEARPASRRLPAGFGPNPTDAPLGFDP